MELSLNDMVVFKHQKTLAPINLEFSNKEINVILGPSGSGKTQLLRTIAGLQQPYRGNILLDGINIKNTPVRKRSVAFVYQEFINYSHLSAYDNIAVPLRQKLKLPQEEIESRVHEVADILKISDYLEARPNEMSGGQQQRLAFARALAQKPKLLLLDDPFANLDFQLKQHLRQFLRKSSRECIVIYASSNAEDSLALSARTTVIDQYQTVQQGHAREVTQFPSHLSVAKFSSEPAFNILEGQKTGKFFVSIKGFKLDLGHKGDLIPEGPCYLGISPDRIHRAESLDSPSGKVEFVEPSGHLNQVTLSTEENEVIVLRVSQLEEIRVGSKLHYAIDLDSLFFYSANGQLILAPQENDSYG
ncbi:ABC transporter ATP-binding protein [Pseudobacteriovorax antillogorgiicola]|uniref:Carbohydrate ABC transporter ATP-binding protein, CUT1 family n=1 Tax=Pseudobacteriovorax antillogorgiicola TaxID=1513793 RepID=A0A1Y6CG25_9BACT|nr:ABC transporter ATP-binding protein [Pseudobacteriovorax antillogorgiicola]TCS47625.1 carbohydrate ABC transporter ATP-binding protein (CUT1 family) [Pseudobacteriovorax antillogorgiicola]SMF59999.1 carbohydrate ABC transporter ATP-binding protein, CUT1 family [Pseudobacteriovorax antillogorgiicola]